MAMLPTHNGVGPSCVGLPAGPWPTIIDFLVQRFPAIARDVWLQRMARGQVIDEQGTPVTPGQAYQAHRRVYYYRDLPAEPRIPFEEIIVFQDEHLLVADKPHFLPVTPSGRYLQETLLVRLKRKLGLDALQPIHRIDRETAGLVVFSIQPETRDAYHALFRQRAVIKHYEAVAPWRAGLGFPMTRESRIVEGEPFFKMCEQSGPPNSETRLEVLEVRGTLARYRLSPVTGKKHQLRVHMNALGLPIVGDLIYPRVVNSRAQQTADDYSRPLQLLARSVEFMDPITGQPRRFESERRLKPGLAP